ncbi:MAG: PDZ domain-containing protein [Anaerolineales bacterium]
MTTQAVSTNELTAEAQIDVPVGQIYYAFSTRSGWAEWFAEKGFGHVEPGSILEIYHETAGKFAIIFQEMVPDERVELAFLNLKTLHASEVEILLAESGQGTGVSITHRRLEDEEYDRFKDLWQDGLLTLKVMMEKAEDPRIWGRPFLGVTVDDWVTPEIAKEKNLSTDSGMRLSNVFDGKGAEQAGIQGGDVIVSLAGTPLVDYESLKSVFAQHRAGDTVDVEYFHDEELKKSRLTLSEYPVPEVPGTAQDIAEKLAHFYTKVNTAIERLLEDKLEAQTEYRPAAGEWNAKEIIAHLIASEVDTISWMGSYIVGKEEYIYISATPARIKSLLAAYPTIEALMDQLRRTQQELVALISEVPADVVSRKSSLIRLAMSYSLSITLHYKDHLSQLKSTLEAAADIGGS